MVGGAEDIGPAAVSAERAEAGPGKEWWRLPGEVLTADAPTAELPAELQAELPAELPAGGLPAGEPPTGGLAAAVVARNEVIRWGIEGVLGAVPEIGTVRGCGSPGELAALLAAGRLNLVVGAAADAGWLAGVRGRLAELATTILLVVDNASLGELPSYAATAAHGYLWQQDLTTAKLREVLRRCRSGEIPMPADLARTLLARADERVPHRPGAVNLTSREREALALLVNGLSNKQIARALSISSHGAKRLVTSIMLKLDAPNRTLAAVIAVRSGLVSDGGPAGSQGRNGTPSR